LGKWKIGVGEKRGTGLPQSFLKGTANIGGRAVAWGGRWSGGGGAVPGPMLPPPENVFDFSRPGFGPGRSSRGLRTTSARGDSQVEGPPGGRSTPRELPGPAGGREGQLGMPGVGGGGGDRKMGTPAQGKKNRGGGPAGTLGPCKNGAIGHGSPRIPPPEGAAHSRPPTMARGGRRNAAPPAPGAKGQRPRWAGVRPTGDGCRGIRRWTTEFSPPSFPCPAGAAGGSREKGAFFRPERGEKVPRTRKVGIQGGFPRIGKLILGGAGTGGPFTVEGARGDPMSLGGDRGFGTAVLGGAGLPGCEPGLENTTLSVGQMWGGG